MKTKKKTERVKEENKMKKLIAILLVLLVASVAFGAGPFNGYTNSATKSDLELTTTVAGRYGLKVTADQLGTLTPAAFISATDVAEIPFTENVDGTVDSETFYINYMTNQRIMASVTATADPLVGETTGNDSTIYYTVTPAVGSAVDVEAAGTSITLYAETAISKGMRVVSESFTIAMDSDTWLNATQDSYSTTWTINLTVNN
jgi:hypothetical protein